MPTVLVTGASRGLGLELVRQYGADGWRVFACARAPRTSAALSAVVGQCGGRVSQHTVDVLDLASIDALGRELTAESIDVFINCAGTMGGGNFAKQGLAIDRFGSADFDDWMRVYRTNVIGPMKLAETFVEQVARSEQKKLITLSSILGSTAKNTIGGLYSYRASKAAVNAIMRSMAIDLRKQYQIIAIPLHPGWVRTEMGGPKADIDAVASVTGMRSVIAGLTADQAGRFWMYSGEELPW